MDANIERFRGRTVTAYLNGDRTALEKTGDEGTKRGIESVGG